MSAIILSIGTYHFVLESATVAVAIHEALKGAPVVDQVAEQNGRVAWRESLLPAPTLSVRQTIDEIGKAPGKILTSPLTAAILGEPTRSRRNTHRVLIPSRQLSAA